MELIDSYALTLPSAFRDQYAQLRVIMETPKRPITKTEDAWEAVAMAHIHMIDGNIDVWTDLISPAIWFFTTCDTEITGTRRYTFDHIMKAHQSSLMAVITLCRWPEVAREPVKKGGRPKKVLTDDAFVDV